MKEAMNDLKFSSLQSTELGTKGEDESEEEEQDESSGNEQTTR